MNRVTRQRTKSGLARVMLAVMALVIGSGAFQPAVDDPAAGPEGVKVDNTKAATLKATGSIEIEWPGGKGREIPPGEEKLALAEFEAFPERGDKAAHGQFTYRVLNADGTLHREIRAEVEGAFVDDIALKAWFVGYVVSDVRLCSGCGGDDGGCGDDTTHDDGGCSGSGGPGDTGGGCGDDTTHNDGGCSGSGGSGGPGDTGGGCGDDTTHNDGGCSGSGGSGGPGDTGGGCGDDTTHNDGGCSGSGGSGGPGDTGGGCGDDTTHNDGGCSGSGGSGGPGDTGGGCGDDTTHNDGGCSGSGGSGGPGDTGGGCGDDTTHNDGGCSGSGGSGGPGDTGGGCGDDTTHDDGGCGDGGDTGETHDDGGCSGSGGTGGSGGHISGKESRVGQYVIVKVHDKTTPGEDGDGITWKWFAPDNARVTLIKDDISNEPTSLCKKTIIGGNLVVHIPEK